MKKAVPRSASLEAERNDIKQTDAALGYCTPVTECVGRREMVMAGRKETERKRAEECAYSSRLRLRILEMGEASRSVEKPSELEELEMLAAAE
jgi:hypothetical protein